MRDFLVAPLRIMGICLFLLGAKPLVAQVTLSVVKGPDFGTVGTNTQASQVPVNVNMDPASGVRTSSAVAIGPSAATSLGSITFTVPAGHSWRFQFNLPNGWAVLSPIRSNGRTVHWFPTNLNGPNLYPNGDTGVSDGTPITRTWSGACEIVYLLPNQTYRGTVDFTLTDTTDPVNPKTVLGTAITQIIVNAMPTLSKVSDLFFGAILANSVNGTVVIPATGSASSTGGVNFLPTYTGALPKAAQFNITGSANKIVILTLPTSAITLTEPISGKTLSVDTFTRSPSGTVTLSSGGSATVNVGATLQVGAGPLAPGTYSGVFQVLCAYQ